MALLEERTPQGSGAGGGIGPRGRGQSMGMTGARPQTDPHRLHLADRKHLTVTGVQDVLSFDVSEVQLETTLGMLTIRGSELHVQRLTLEKGEVDVTGKVDSLTYSDVGTYRKQGESLLARLFR